MRGFAPEYLDAADRVLDSGVAGGQWPGLVAAAGVGEVIQRQWVLGDAERWAGGHREMRADAVFDLASLTKVLATAPSALLLIQRGAVRLADRVRDYVPGVDPRLTVHHLLTHTSGLPANLNLVGQARTPEELIAGAARRELANEPGAVVTYSDVGFVLLGGVVAAASGRTLGEFVAGEILAPLGSGARYQPPPQWLPRIAATEVVDGRPVHGRVHDENAAAAVGPVGHAGLFATLPDVLACLRMWREGGPLLEEPLRAEAMRDHTGGLGGHRGLGWTCRGDRFDILGDGWGPAAVSHTGFTGTSIALEPGSQRWAVLLSNAVHFGRGRPGVLAARRRFHRVLVGDPSDEEG